MSPHERSALAAFFDVGWRRAAAERAATFGRALLLTLILLIFFATWSATPLTELGPSHLSVAELLWYLGATEIVTLSAGFPYRLIETDIQNGDIASAFVRPVRYVLATFANCLGELTYRFIAMTLVTCVVCVLATHTVPVSPIAGAVLLVALWIGTVLVLLSQLCIGVLATWMKSAAPAFWVWQKLLFVLGGLIIPITLYPAWLAKIALATPFAATLFLPASLIFDASPAHMAQTFGAQLFWFAALAAVAWLLHARMEAHLRLHGA